MRQPKYRENLNQKFKHYNGKNFNYRGFEINKSGITILYDLRKITITYVNENIVSVFIGDLYENKTPSNAVILDKSDIKPYVEEDLENIIIHGNKIKTYIKKSDSKITFKDCLDKIICDDYEPSFKDEFGDIYISKINNCYAYYGFGEKGGSLNKKGCYLENFNTDDPETDDDYLIYYKTIPFYVGLNKNKTYGMFFDNSFRSYFDMGKSFEDRVFFGATGGQIQYYFILGENMKEVVYEYSNLTGRMDMPPLWSLGYQQNRFSYTSEQEVLDLVEKFNEKEIPLDVVYLDIDYMDGFRVMTFKNPEFKNIKETILKLKNMGIKTVTMMDPGVKIDANYSIYCNGLNGNHFVKTNDGNLFVGSVWPGKSAFPDFSNKDCRKWWKSELKNFISEYQIDGIWNDMNEPCVFDNEFKTIPYNCIHNSDHGIIEHKEFHNRYGFEMSRCSNEAQKELRPNIREFSMTRATYAGGQRYSSIWTGDNSSLWSQLRMSIPMNSNLGISGFSFVGNDVGGFSFDCNAELFIRWMQVGTFLPIFRNHSNMYTRRQEPWAFGENVEKIVKKAIELRYKFLPYIYTSFYDSYRYGLPVFRPLVMEYPNDINTLNIKEEFMVGENILIAPVLYEGGRTKNVYLPKGNWYEYNTNKIYKGESYYTLKCDLNEILIFIKQGSIIPTYDKTYLNVENRPCDITFIVYGDTASGNYYYDDGKTNDYKNGKYNFKTIKINNNEIKEEFIHKGLENDENSNFIFVK